MNTPRSPTRRIGLAILILLLLTAGWIILSPTFSRIHTVTAVDSPQTLRNVFNGNLPWKYVSWRKIWQGGSPCVSIGPGTMEWSSGGNDTSYLYVWGGDSSTPTWEFAPCEQRRLIDVTLEDTRRDFYGQRSRGFDVFGENWRTNALKVNDSRIYLARLAKAPETVYALKVEQERDWMARIHYLQVTQPRTHPPKSK